MRELEWAENLFNKGGRVPRVPLIQPVPCPECSSRGHWQGITCRGVEGPRLVVRCGYCGYNSGRSVSTDSPASFAGAAYYIYYRVVGWKQDTFLFLQ